MAGCICLARTIPKLGNYCQNSKKGKEQEKGCLFTLELEAIEGKSMSILKFVSYSKAQTNSRI